MKRADTKEKLLSATLSLISEKGYLGATTREISTKAGVTELTLFRHFGSKEKLFEEMLKKYSFLPQLKELKPLLYQLSYSEALNMVGITFFDTLKERKSLVKIMLSELNLYPDKAREVQTRFVEEMVRTLAGYLKVLQNKKKVKALPPDDMARMFLRNIFSYFLSEEIFRAKDLKQKDIERNIGLYVDIFINGTLDERAQTRKKRRK